MASRDRAVVVQRALVVVLAVVLFVVAVVAGLWAGERNRDADRSAAGAVALADHPLAEPGAQAMRKE